jgi:hypothetical protein
MATESTDSIEKAGPADWTMWGTMSITAYFVNVLLGNTRIWETLRNVTPGYYIVRKGLEELLGITGTLNPPTYRSRLSAISGM